MSKKMLERRELIIITNMVGADYAVFIKRTDAMYEKTPYGGFDKGAEAWLNEQKENRVIENITFGDVLSGVIDRSGAFDNDGEHVIDDTALRLAQKFNINRICPLHVAPFEMYVETIDGKKHVITGQEQPDYEEEIERNLRMWDCVLGVGTGYMIQN